MGTNFASLIADICLYSYEADFIQTSLEQLASQFSFTYKNIDEVLSINNPDFDNYQGWCIPLSLRTKTRRRATLTLPLPTWIYCCRSGGTVSCSLPFITNVTMSTSTRQTFRSWVALFDLRPPLAFLAHTSFIIQGLASLMNVAIWVRFDFLKSFTGIALSGNVWNQSCPWFATSMTRQASSWIANHGHSDGIPLSLPKCSDRFFNSAFDTRWIKLFPSKLRFFPMRPPPPSTPQKKKQLILRKRSVHKMVITKL